MLKTFKTLPCVLLSSNARVDARGSDGAPTVNTSGDCIGAHTSTYTQHYSAPRNYVMMVVRSVINRQHAMHTTMLSVNCDDDDDDVLWGSGDNKHCKHIATVYKHQTVEQPPKQRQ